MQHSVALPASAAPSVSGMPFESRASGGEYFRIWIVNLLLTVLTLGIYSAWAKVRSLRYFYGTTSLDGTAFEYHGTGLQILKGRLIAFGVLAIYSLTVQFAPVVALIFIPIFFFGLPWVIVKARTFQMRVSSWRNVRFNFHGTYGGAMAAYIGWALLAVTLYTLVPLWLWKRTRYIVDNTTFGAERFRFATPMGRFFAFWYIAVGLGIAALIVFSFVFGAAMAGIIAARKAARRRIRPPSSRRCPVASRSSSRSSACSRRSRSAPTTSVRSRTRCSTAWSWASIACSATCGSAVCSSSMSRTSSACC
jgi:uncharacterized membrane protein YjgN (DUF898 family)